MKDPALRRPTDAELDILRALWELGPSTVRQVHEALARDPAGRGSGQTTVLKHMQIMVEKGLLERDEGVRPQIYRPTRSAGQTQKQLLTHLLDKAFGGSAANLVMQALSTDRATPEERDAIRSLLDRMEPTAGDAGDPRSEAGEHGDADGAGDEHRLGGTDHGSDDAGDEEPAP